MGIENYWGFLAAAVVLNLTPGADTVYILSRTLQQGQRAGVASVLGIGSGILIHVLLVALGLAQVVARSPLLFAVLQYAGAAYLVYLGIRMWRHRTPLLEAGRSHAAAASWQIYGQGLITNLLNPKIVLFFLALLPQFVQPAAANQLLPYVLLGGSFVVTGTLWCLLVVRLADGFKRQLLHRPAAEIWLNRICGGLLMGLGLKVALSR